MTMETTLVELNISTKTIIVNIVETNLDPGKVPMAGGKEKMENGHMVRLEAEAFTIMGEIINTDTTETIIDTVTSIITVEAMVAIQTTTEATLRPTAARASIPKNGGSSSRRTSSTV